MLIYLALNTIKVLERGRMCIDIKNQRKLENARQPMHISQRPAPQEKLAKLARLKDVNKI